MKIGKSRLLAVAFLFLFWTSGQVAEALDFSLEAGYAASDTLQNTGGGFDYLPNGDIIAITSDYVNGPSVYVADANGDGSPAAAQVITSYDSYSYGSFVKVSPSGTFALFGTTGTVAKIHRVDLSTLAVTDVVTVTGNTDLVFFDEDTVYVSANGGSFDPSVPSKVYRIELSDPETLVPVVEISNSPAGPMAFNSSGDLYYIKSTWTYPAPAASHRLFRFAAADVSQAATSGTPLTESSANATVVLDSGYDLVINRQDSTNNILFISQLEAGVLRISENDFSQSRLISVSDSSSYSYLAFSEQDCLFEPYAPSDCKLGAAVAANYYTEYYLVSIQTDPVDSDGDGVVDYNEWQAGTAANDPGSLPDCLSSPVFSLWNGFLDMVNILELVNKGDTDVQAHVSLYRLDGSLGSTRSVPLAAHGEFDVILNDMEGFSANSYGLVKLEFDQGTIDGRITYYRGYSNPADFDFVFAVPLSNPRYGETAVAFNTYHPTDNNGVVANWLSIVNLSSNAKDFQIVRYAQDGELLFTQTVTVPAQGRTDLEGGHVSPGANRVGLNRIIPQDASAPYIAQSIRYGVNSSGGYDFGSPLLAKAGTGSVVYVPLSTENSSQNWVELINSSSNTVSATVDCRNEGGTSVLNRALELPAFAQEHLYLTDLLGENSIGFCRVLPQSLNSIIAQSMTYYREGSSGSLLTINGVQHREALGRSLSGSYNLFLGMSDSVELHNVTDSAINVNVSVFNGNGESAHQVQIAAQSSSRLALNDYSQYGTAADTYGVVTVGTPNAAEVFADVIRNKVVTSTGDLDFRVPTPVR